MMTQNDQQIAKELKGRFSKVVEVLDFRIFGSRAKGTASEDSDMDVFLEVYRLSPDLEKAVRDIAWEIGFKYLIHVSVLIFTQNEIENSPLRDSPIVEVIMEEGIAV